MSNGPLRPHRVGVRITGIHYVELEAVNARHAGGQALLRAAFAAGLRHGGRIDPATGDVSHPAGSTPPPAEIRLDALRNIVVESVEALA